MKGSRKERSPPDFLQLAISAAQDAGFIVDAALDAVVPLALEGASLADATALQLVSIDNDDTQDIDQLTCARRVAGGIEIHVAIADVAAFVPKNSAVDVRAARNTTTLYLSVTNVWMLPRRLCCGDSSLMPGERRPAVITRFTVTPEGKLTDSTIWRAWVINKHKLAVCLG